MLLVYRSAADVLVGGIRLEKLLSSLGTCPAIHDWVHKAAIDVLDRVIRIRRDPALLLLKEHEILLIKWRLLVQAMMGGRVLGHITSRMLEIILNIVERLLDWSASIKRLIFVLLLLLPDQVLWQRSLPCMGDWLPLSQVRAVIVCHLTVRHLRLLVLVGHD